eukprot:4115298-Alexandrium_andersonii.AAC.1
MGFERHFRRAKRFRPVSGLGFACCRHVVHPDFGEPGNASGEAAGQRHEYPPRTTHIRLSQPKSK